jgi:hypothetical protein
MAVNMYQHLSGNATVVKYGFVILTLCANCRSTCTSILRTSIWPIATRYLAITSHIVRYWWNQLEKRSSGRSNKLFCLTSLPAFAIAPLSRYESVFILSNLSSWFTLLSLFFCHILPLIICFLTAPPACPDCSSACRLMSACCLHAQLAHWMLECRFCMSWLLTSFTRLLTGFIDWFHTYQDFSTPFITAYTIVMVSYLSIKFCFHRGWFVLSCPQCSPARFLGSPAFRTADRRPVVLSGHLLSWLQTSDLLVLTAQLVVLNVHPLVLASITVMLGSAFRLLVLISYLNIPDCC